MSEENVPDGLLFLRSAVKPHTARIDGHSSVDEKAADVLMLSRIAHRRSQKLNFHPDTSAVCNWPERSQASVSPFFWRG